MHSKKEKKHFRRRKKVLTFDEDKRKEFLTGFHKRKVERRKKAQHELKEEIKEEKKRLKLDARERHKALLNTRQDIENIEDIMQQKEFETENHKISILELDVSKLDQNHIGQNKVVYDEILQNVDNEIVNTDSENEISGFEMKSKKEKSCKSQLSTDSGTPFVNSKKQLKKQLSAFALKELKNSKIFKKKMRLEKQKNKHLHKLEKLRKTRSESKKNKLRKGKKK